MGANLFLTIAICTKNREPQLVECVKHAVASAAVASKTVQSDIHIVDDGKLSKEFENSLRSFAEEYSVGLTVSRKTDIEGSQPGLYGSRRFAAVSSSGDYLLFIDDDCNIGKTYISDLAATFLATGAVAVGGVDHRNVPAEMAAWKEILFRVFLLWGNQNGDLSKTGFNYGHHLWRRQNKSFRSNWLHGCNMAYDRKSIISLPDCPWLQGHAACEDLVTSHHAGKHGAIIVNPKLDFVHLEVPGGRGNFATRIKKKIRGHWNFHNLRNGTATGKMLFAWSALGFLFYLSLRALSPRLNQSLNRKQS